MIKHTYVITHPKPITQRGEHRVQLKDKKAYKEMIWLQMFIRRYKNQVKINKNSHKYSNRLKATVRRLTGTGKRWTTQQAMVITIHVPLLLCRKPLIRHIWLTEADRRLGSFRQFAWLKITNIFLYFLLFKNIIIKIL